MDQPEKHGQRMFITEQDHGGVYGFCETCPDHHDMVLFYRDGTGSLDSEPKIFPSHHT